MNDNMIMTLDGRFWEKDMLIKEMYDDHFYYSYLGQYSLSSSSVKKLLDSPKAYVKSLRQSDNSPALIAGRLVHLSVLEPEKFQELNFIDVQSRNTKKFKEAVEQNPETFTIKEYNSAMYLAEALHSNKHAMDLLSGLDKEVPMVGNLFDKPFRGKADAIGNGRIVDLKTCADLSKFKWNAKDFKYMCQVYIYCNLFGIDYKDFYFLVIDKNTNDIGIFDVSESFYNLGESLVEQAVENYVKYIQNGRNELHNYTVRDTL
jgi:hypothetical protein